MNETIREEEGGSHVLLVLGLGVKVATSYRRVIYMAGADRKLAKTLSVRDNMVSAPAPE